MVSSCIGFDSEKPLLHNADAMRTHEINAALCLLGGWVKKKYEWVDNCGVPHKAYFWIGDEGEVLPKQPDIRNDLNLINRIERKLTEKQHREFRGILNNSPLSDRDYVSASGPNRAEAILKAVNLWK
jgi:hypothetical protein